MKDARLGVGHLVVIGGGFDRRVVRVRLVEGLLHRFFDWRGIGCAVRIDACWNHG
jgi:hypothetical protein